MKLTSYITGLIFIFLSIACSGGSNPALPSNPDGISGDSSIISESSISDYAVDTRGVLGAWSVAVDTKSLTAEILPARNAKAIGNIFDADLTQFLEVSPCANCVNVGNIYFDDYGRLNVSMRMRHPFANLAARPDLHGFDVRGIFILPSTVNDDNIQVTMPDNMVENASYSTLLLNPDGYTSHFDELPADSRYFVGGVDISGNLNPFLRFFEDYTTPVFDPNLPHGYNVIPVGSMNYERTAIFGKFTDIMQFYFIADVSYGQSAVLANRMNPQYYLPSFNRTEAWRVEYYIENNTLDKNDNTSAADIMVQVFDWQQGATVDPAYPNPSNLSGIRQQSNVLRVELSVPLLQDDAVIQSVPESGSGTPTDPLLYRLTITNVNAYDYSPVWGLIAVRDDLYGQASPNGRTPIPASPAGFPYETLDIRDYTLYAPVYINFFDGDTVYESSHSIFGNNELFVPKDNQIARYISWGVYRTQIYPMFFMDPSGRRFQYRWDYDYDGVTFDVDGAGMPSPEIEFSTPGLKNVALRVRSNTVPPHEYIYQIPVWAEGVAFNNTIPAGTALRNSTSTARSHALASNWQLDEYYLAYTSEVGGQRDIWLAIIQRDGSMTTHQVTNDAAADYDPSIELAPIGSYAGVYIAYCSYDGTSLVVKTTYGGLDGTGFDVSHQKRVSTAPDPAFEYAPILDIFGVKLCVYYYRYVPVTLQIYDAHSTDWGLTWTNHGAVANNGSTMQGNHAIAYGGFSRNCIVWEDYKDSARGGDLWMAETTDGYTFTNIRNISSFDDNTHETNPSIDYTGGLGVITYLTYPDGSSDTTARVKFIGLSPYYDTHTDVAITEGLGANLIHTIPTVNVSSNGHCFVAYGSWNQSTEQLTEYLLDFHQTDITGLFDETVLLERSMGTISDAFEGNNLNPALYVRFTNDNVHEIVYTRRDFSSGSYQSPIAPIQMFGEITASYITVPEVVID